MSHINKMSPMPYYVLPDIRRSGKSELASGATHDFPSLLKVQSKLAGEPEVSLTQQTPKNLAPTRQDIIESTLRQITVSRAIRQIDRPSQETTTTLAHLSALNDEYDFLSKSNRNSHISCLLDRSNVLRTDVHRGMIGRRSDSVCDDDDEDNIPFECELQDLWFTGLQPVVFIIGFFFVAVQVDPISIRRRKRKPRRSPYLSRKQKYSESETGDDRR